MIKSVVKNLLLQNKKKWTLQKNEEKYAVVKQSKEMTKMNPKKDKRLVPFELLHSVILCFWISVIVFRIYDSKKFQICLIFYVFFFKPRFPKMLFFWHAGKNISRIPNPINLKFSGISFHIKHIHWVEKNMSSIDPK